MTKTCVICKKQPIPGDNTRSFHKFPADNELKEKWMEVIGIQEIKKVSTVCSDHFGDDSYHQTDGYTKTRRLLSSAVPSSIEETASETCSSDIDEYSLSNSLDSSSSTNNAVSDFIPQDLLTVIIGETDLTFPQAKGTGTTTSDNNSINSKRKQSINNESTLPKKKFCFMDGCQPTHISRQDFVSEEAWGRFVKLMRYKNTQIASARKRRWRIEKKNRILKEFSKKFTR